MKIQSLSTTSVRGLRDGTWLFTPERGGPGHMTVVTGPPGAGLTTFLDAVAFTAAKLATGSLVPSAADVVHAGAGTALIRTSFRLDPDERAFGGLSEETTEAEVTFQRGGAGRVQADPGLLGLMTRYDNTPKTSKVVSIPARRFGDGAAVPIGSFESDMRFHRLSSSPGKFAGLLGALDADAGGRGDRARFEAVQALFAELCPTARLVRGAVTREVELELTSGMHVALGALSFSERNAFVLAAAPVLLGLQRSIVLLDTPEMGLGAGEAARWLGVLRRHFSEAQWIVASRDPAVVASAELASRIELSGGAS